MGVLDFDSKVMDLLDRLAGLLKQRGWKMVTAESCTGGWIAKCCTDLAGSSTWFERGFVTYSNSAKEDLLAVQATDLKMHGAVSDAVARQMTVGALQNSRADVALAVTGIAGPESDDTKKPIGLVYFGWCVPDQPVCCEKKMFTGQRDGIRRQTVLHALQGLVSRLETLG